MDSSSEEARAGFRPTRPASRARKMLAFALGAFLWAAALWLALVLLGHTYILRTLLLATVASWVVFGIVLACGIAMRHREERHASH